MQSPTEKQVIDIVKQSFTSSTLRLLYELIQWDNTAEDTSLSIVADELGKRYKNSTERLLVELFFICFLEANLFSAFKEKWYIFDEDEKEIRRQLRIDFSIHLCIIISLSLITLFEVYILGLLALYLLWTVYWASKFYLPAKKRLKHKVR